MKNRQLEAFPDDPAPAEAPTSAESYPTATPITERIMRSSAVIALDTPADLLYQHTVLCQTALPYRPMRERMWVRRNGRITLLIKAGEIISDEGVIELPLPHGSRARLTLLHLNREALHQRSPTIEMDRSLTAFAKRLQGRAPNSRDIRRLKTQLSALSTATIRLGIAGENRHLQVNSQIVDGFDLWAPKAPEQHTLWPSTVTLNSRYYESLVEHAVPLDQRAIAALQHSAVALDVYAWLAQRLHRIPNRREAFIPWTALHEQFGAGYTRLRDFRSAFLAQLRAVHTQYPEARVEVDKTAGIRLRHSPPPIPPRLITGPGTTIETGE